MVQRLFIWAFVIGVIAYGVQNPKGAAGTGKAIFHGLGVGVGSFFQFVTSLFS